jgi:CO/xanthine dehydrogenase Mo-binding subunit
MDSLRVVGTSPPRLDAREKVTGRAVFITDLQIPGMASTPLLRWRLPGCWRS